MGSVTNSLTSTANTQTTTPANSSNSNSSRNTNTTGIFTGTSAYSADFQNLIDRAVAIASLPINLLTAQQTALNSQSTELNTLDTKFSALQTAIQGITTALGGASFVSTSSAPTLVTATLGDGAAEGIYNITVDNPGVTATSLSTATWNQPALASGQTATYGLVVGNQEYSVTTSDNSAQGVAAAIRAQWGGQVNALAVNVGTNDWRISLQSPTLGPVNLNLILVPSSATPASLQTQDNYAISQTTGTWASAAGPYTLLVNDQPYSLTPTDNSAQQVAVAINAAATANALQVNATVVDLGTGSNHDYRIQLVGTTAGAMTLDIQNGASTSLQTQAPATSETTATWNPGDDVTGKRSQYTLVAGASHYNFVAEDNSAQKVAAAVNSQFGAMVKATVVDLTGSGDYRIALQDKTGSSPTLDIQKTAADSLQTQQTIGQLAQYELDGAAPATSTSASISVANGVTLNLLAAGSASLTVTRSTSALSTALATFTDAYNAAVDEVGGQRGQSAGPLQGQSILSVLSRSLSALSLYGSSSGSIATMKELGMELGKDGHIAYTPLTLMGATFARSADVTSFLGSATGGGFLKAATDALANLQDPTAGLLKTAETDMQTQITNIGHHIATKQTQVDRLQQQLISQMVAADAAIASMEQQYSYLSSMFQAQQTAAQMYK